MRVGQVVLGMRVRIVGGRGKGERGTVVSKPQELPPGSGYIGASKCGVDLDDGTRVFVMPRWIEPA